MIEPPRYFYHLWYVPQAWIANRKLHTGSLKPAFPLSLDQLRLNGNTVSKSTRCSVTNWRRKWSLNTYLYIKRSDRVIISISEKYSERGLKVLTTDAHTELLCWLDLCCLTLRCVVIEEIGVN